MRFKYFFVGLFLFIILLKLSASMPNPDLAYCSKFETVNIDSVMRLGLTDTVSISKVRNKHTKSNFKQLVKSTAVKPVQLPKSLIEISHITDTVVRFKIPTNIPAVKVDSILLLSNPFFIDLVYKGLASKSFIPTNLKTIYYGQKAQYLQPDLLKHSDSLSVNQLIYDLRNDIRDKITQSDADLYRMTFDELPDPNGNKTRFIKKNTITDVEFDEDDENLIKKTQLIVKTPKLGPWQYKASSMAQFSESIISSNWYQGGNSNLAILGILSAQLTYDDKKNIQWDNSGEWRMGFNSVAGDSINPLSTNDDIFKINSKLGIKAGGNFFYSASVDFSTQIFNSYNGINSRVLKTSFLTPVRLNIGVGLDYKYKKIWSLLISPFSYKYIYLNNPEVNPNLFGVKAGQNLLSEIGSSFKITYSNLITKEIQLDSKFSFYTNYQKVEIDWETVCEMKINRFLSTRISFNPRYDNTVIEKNGLVAKLQFKQFLSVGFSHKFL